VNVVGQGLIISPSIPKPPPWSRHQQHGGKEWPKIRSATAGDPKRGGAKGTGNAAHVEKAVKANKRSRLREERCSGANIHLSVNRSHHDLHGAEGQRKAEITREGNKGDEEYSPKGQDDAQDMQGSALSTEVAGGRTSCCTSGDPNG
jgi:hypothetical protein